MPDPEIPDGDLDILGSTESTEDREGRGEAFTGLLGIPDTQLALAIDQATRHALAATPAAIVHNWYPIGPRNVGGRIRELIQDPSDRLTFYAGSSAGGVWRTRDGGDVWECLAEVGSAPHLNQHNYEVSALAIPEESPNIVYIGTGDPVVGFAAGRGLWRATIQPDRQGVQFDQLANPGVTANATPQPAANRYNKICVDPDEPHRFWAACPTGVWQCDVPIGGDLNPNNLPGFWKRVFPPNPAGAFPVPAVPPAEAAFATDLLAVRDPRGGHPENNVLLFAGISGQGIFRGRFDRTTANITWDPVVFQPGTAPAPAAFGRVKLAQCKTKPQHVYAVLEASLGAGVVNHQFPTVVFHSPDYGANWTAGANLMPRSVGWVDPAAPAAPLTGIAWYALVLAVHPERENVVLSGSIDLWLSEDSGNNWRKLLAWELEDTVDRAQHGDLHAVIFDEEDLKRIWIAHDGGISTAADIRRPPFSPNFWRKRSHGILCAQFQDVTAHPAIPLLCGGGLQDNGTWLSYGGPSWYRIGGGDGGMMAFDPTNPRRFFVSSQAGIDRATVGAGPGGFQAPVLNELPAALSTFRVTTARVTNPPLLPATCPTAAPCFSAPFVGVVEHHPAAAQTLLIGRVGGAFLTGNGGAAWSQARGAGGAAIPFTAGEFVKSVAFSPVVVGGQRAAWFGTSLGRLFRTANVALNSVWTAANNPGVAAAWPPVNNPINRIAFHPVNPNAVAVATGGAQGRLMLTFDAGAHWTDVTGAVGSAPPTSLPPGPMTSAQFDPQNPTSLYIGTLAGVFLLQNVPAPGAPPAAGLVPAFPFTWLAFNHGLPLTVVNDLAIVRGPTIQVGGAPVVTRMLRAATFGRSMYDCRLGAAITSQLYIRQTVIDDGVTTPRPAIAALPFQSDPRVAAGAAGAGLDMAHAFDIRIGRIGAPPLANLEGTVDGVEFDEDLGAGPLLPGQTNFVCVQVLNSGFQAAQNVAVHLYFQQVASVAAANGLGNLGDFWRKPQNFDPVGASPWQRVGPPVILPDVGPANPGVARFEWVPPTVLAGNSVALVAICSGAPPDDLPAAIPGGAATVAALIANELRSALRVAGVGPFAAPRPNIFIRHGGDDEGAPGDVRFGGRSPDIIVVQAAPANPKAAFQDLIAPRSDDFISPTGSNFIYVRVHNRGDFPVPVDVQLFWAKPNVAADAAEAQAPPFDNTKWSGVAPLTSANNVVIPPHDWDLAKLQWDSPQTTVRADNPHASIVLIALIKSSDNQDPIPVRTRVSGLAEFFDFFRILPDSENTAMRAIGYHAAL